MESTELSFANNNQQTNFSFIEDQSEERMIQSIAAADSIIRMNHLAVLDRFQIVPLQERSKHVSPEKKARIMHISCLTYDAQENAIRKLSSVFGAIANYDASAALIVHHDGTRIHLYMGTSCEDPQMVSLVFGTFERSLKGNFPGCVSEVLPNDAGHTLFENIFDYDLEDSVSVASISSITFGDWEQKISCLHGMEKLADAMKGIPFALVVLASALSHETISVMRQGYETLYTELSPFHKRNATLSKSDTLSFSKTVGESISKSISMTTGTSSSVSKTTGSSNSISNSRESATEKEKGIVALGAGLMMAAALTNPAVQGIALLGNSVTQSVQTITGTKPGSRSETNSEHTDHSETTGQNESSGRTDTKADTESTTDSNSSTEGKTVSLTVENRSVGTILDAIDKHIRRLNACEGSGAYHCAAYLIAADRATAQMGASLYRSLLSGDSAGRMVSYVNIWQKPEETALLCEYLKYMKHPVFQIDDDNHNLSEVTAALPTTVDELPVHFVWPQKSLPGLTVTTHADFARDILSVSSEQKRSVLVGKILHMGNTEPCDVFIAPEELRKHVFVCGAPGSGKSNFCYILLNRLIQQGVRFMVVEPAKGEYSSVFGGREGVNVFGTNRFLTPQLSINPFEFPEGIHLLEHMDRMIEVFNASWPMYAAMPALLKEGMEKAYTSCGWNLYSGMCETSPPIFPTFLTLMEVLPTILKQTEYSEEVQGNYIGSLLTRIKSMTNGICGQLFCSDPIPDATLFDENTIIDISRLGSAETKALIMGILIIRLQEYRSCNRSGINEELRHVTLLEEAHHLLRQTSTVQSMDGANLRGMSVEILTNAIAEMRTYGEGFLIADQTPSAMADAVIGNTGTKVIFKLPNTKDRLPVGNAIALNESQINEIAKLETGAAIIYQNHWISPVLCKIDRFPEKEFVPLRYQPQILSSDEHKTAREKAISLLLKARAEQSLPIIRDMEPMIRILRFSDNSSDKQLVSFFNNLRTAKDTDCLSLEAIERLFKAVYGKDALPPLSMDRIDDWYAETIDILRRYTDLPIQELHSIISILIIGKRETEPNAIGFFFSWKSFLWQQKNKDNV